MTIEKILSTLPNLSSEEIAKVSTALAALKATTTSRGEIHVDIQNDWLLHGIVRELEARGQGSLIPKGFAITKVKSFRGYAKHYKKVQEWITKQFDRPLAKPELLCLGDIAAGSLGALITAWDYPVTLHMMCNNINRIPEAIMRQFPGYVEAGLLSWVLRAQRPQRSSRESESRHGQAQRTLLR